MPVNTEWMKIDGERVVPSIDQALQNLDGAGDEIFLDFSSVRRIDAQAVLALERSAGAADEKGARIVLRGVNIDVYRVLKQMNLASRFTFLA